MNNNNSLITLLTKILASLGGGIILFILLITCINIIGRNLNSPIPGIFEITELAMASAIFMFLPYCQRCNKNIFVEIFTNNLGDELKLSLHKFSAILYFMISILITWRLIAGGWDFFKFNEQTMMLSIPKYIVFIPMTLSSLLLCIVCFLSIFNKYKVI